MTYYHRSISSDMQRLRDDASVIAYWANMPEPHISEYRSDLDYHGRYME
ncbi:MAG TPA: hypothetical protein P5186_28650 [Candidatus Paceibacterota bacterium]|nr:hypothetical protein [Candidatus Paceibacterota bacterium]